MIPKFLLILLLTLATSAAAQNKNAPTPVPATPTVTGGQEDEQSSSRNATLDALKERNQKAQAEYYEGLTKKLNESEAEKSFWTRFKESASESPASVLGVLGAFGALLGAVIVARTGFRTFLFNYYATIRNQSDTQFYEALKRFGDKDSAATRASAAGMLAVLARKRVAAISDEPSFWSRTASLRKFEQPYVDLTIQQFLAGLVLERNETVLRVINSELVKLISLRHESARDDLKVVADELDVQCTEALSEYFASVGVNDVAHADEIALARAAAIMSLESTDELRRRLSLTEPRTQKELAQRIQRATKMLENYDSGKKSQHNIQATRNLALAATRLRFVGDLLRKF